MQSKLEELFNSIESSSLYQDYKKMEAILEKDTTIKGLLEEIKELEQKATYLENINDPEYMEVDKLIKEKASILNDNPVYKEYLEKMNEFNNSLSESSKMISNYLEEIV